MEFGKKEIFDYELPKDRIAQRPVHPRDSARLLVVERDTLKIRGSLFSELPKLLTAKDILVFNDSRVIPARLFGKTPEGKRIELLFLRCIGTNRWICMGTPLKKLKPDVQVQFENNVVAKIIDRVSEREVVVEIEGLDGKDVIGSLLETEGIMPIPPYIRDGLGDKEDVSDYQSIFAKISGSVAASTASLHFTGSLLKEIQAKGVRVETVTLHLGPPSFLSIWEKGEKEVSPPGFERYVYSEEFIKDLMKRKENGSRVIAVGTSVVRALESMARNLKEREESGSMRETDLFIYPGFDFKVVDALVTNFHQPRSSHLLLVQAFLGKDGSGRDLLSNVYTYALQEDFRFLSYGDGMLVV